ncbi:MAG: DUF2653 family protein [Thermoflavifilum sp.]|nr:DUF2653 family protein [Thermoflavifilum sp.]MCL6513207.1 YxcD family protein [Alicyclobacillus sp.]
MRIWFEEQDVIDACCVFVARQHRVRPEQVEVDLQFQEGSGFAADARFGFRHAYLTEQDIVDAIAVYLAEYHQFIPDRLQVDLQYNPEFGIGADILVR